MRRTLLVALLLCACAHHAAANGPATARVHESASTITGTVVHKEWTMTAESYNAGGSDYYYLDVGQAEADGRSADVGLTLGVLLLPSPAVPASELAHWIGMRVRVTGAYVQAHPVTLRPDEQAPLGPDGKPLPRGAGFEVEHISAAE